MKTRIFALAMVAAMMTTQTAWAIICVDKLESPNGEHKVKIFSQHGNMFWCEVLHKDKKILDISPRGFKMKDEQTFPPVGEMSGYFGRIEKTSRVDRVWQPVCGQQRVIRDSYNESVWGIHRLSFGPTVCRIIFRAYDEGIAFCYEFPTKDGETLHFEKELTTFRFEKDYPCWAVYSAQGVYENVPLSEVKPNCERPLLIQIPDGPAVSVGEARLVDFARMRLEPGEKNEYSIGLHAQLAGPVEIKDSGKPFRTPWRFVMAADSPGSLLERSYMLLNLNEPCRIADTSWIKPGKVIRETTLTTEGGRACVDFAVARGLQYIEFDAGWYGPENDDKSDATFVSIDPARKKGELDLHEVIKYADEKGIGVILYVNQRALARQLDELLPLYKEWGIKGIKFGFVHVGSQQWTTWLHEAIAKCAKYEMMVDVHDEYRPTGWERTYPNLMTVEGIRGNEEMPTAEHNIITAGVRMLCGPGDYTPCWYDGRVKTSRAHQLALPVVMYSPWTFLFWYDRPEMYRGEPELDLWKELPTVWDDTRVLVDDIPRTYAVARKSGDTWYVGVLNSGEKRELRVSVSKNWPEVGGNTQELSLEGILAAYGEGAKLTVTTYTDKSDDPRDRGVEIRTVNAGEVKSVTLPLRENGGAVVVVRKE